MKSAGYVVIPKLHVRFGHRNMKLSLCSCRAGTSVLVLFCYQISSNILPFFLIACQILSIYSLPTRYILPSEFLINEH